MPRMRLVMKMVESEETPESEETLELEETPDPEETIEPEETLESEDMSELEETSESEETPEPFETLEPKDTQNSMETLESEETPDPEETLEPEETSESEEMSELEETSEPENTSESEETSEPEETPDMAVEEKDKVPQSKYSCLKRLNWTVEKEIALLATMMPLKPAGVHKHSNMLLIRENFSEIIKETVPTSAIWEYIQHHWNTDGADKIESEVVPIVNKDFELPQTDEWTQLINEEYESILKSNKTEKDMKLDTVEDDDD